MIDSQPSLSTEYMEALLVHHPDPNLHLQLPETPLSQTSAMTIGRQAGAHLLIDEPSVSRRHAVISYINRQYMLQDLGSTNGTFVNDERVELARPCIVRPNDVLRFGNSVAFRFLLRSSSLANQTSTTNNKSSAGWPDKTTVHLKRMVQSPPALNSDGTLSSPGIEQPVPASVVATFKEVPSLIILPPSSGRAKSTPPWVYLLKPGRLIAIGRERGNAIELNDMVVSRRHAELFLAPHGCYIRDLGSSNGVIINQARIERPYRLSHGDRVKLGETIIFFIDLQAGREPTEKRPASVPSVEPNRQKVPSIYNKALLTSPASNSASGVSTSYLGAISNKALLTSPMSNSASGASPSRLAATYHGAEQALPTRRITAVLTSERKVAVVICPRCGVANTQIARFCASCSTALIP